MALQDIAMMIIGQLPGRLPVIIALVVGLVLVAQRRALSPASRKLGVLGFSVLLAANLLGLIAWPLAQAWIINAAMPASQMSMAFALLSVPLALLDAAGLVLLALAIVRRAD